MKILLVGIIAGLLGLGTAQAQMFELSEPAEGQTITINRNNVSPVVVAWLQDNGIEITNAALGVECGEGRVAYSGVLTAERVAFLCGAAQ